jgi:hypothetical protein
MSASTLLYGLNFGEIMLQRTTKLEDTQPWIPIVGFCINGILTTIVALAIDDNDYFVFNTIVLTLNVATSIATSVVLDNLIARIGYPITGLLAMIIFFCSCSHRATLLYNQVNDFGTRVERTEARVNALGTRGEKKRRRINAKNIYLHPVM